MNIGCDNKVLVSCCNIFFIYHWSYSPFSKLFIEDTLWQTLLIYHAFNVLTQERVCGRVSFVCFPWAHYSSRAPYVKHGTLTMDYTLYRMVYTVHCILYRQTNFLFSSFPSSHRHHIKESSTVGKLNMAFHWGKFIK